MIDLSRFEVWFVLGALLLCGEVTLAIETNHSREIANTLSASQEMTAKIVCQSVTVTAKSILEQWNEFS
jgi:L-arabinose isomerase